METRPLTTRDMAPPLALMTLIFFLSSIPGRVSEGGFRFLEEINPNLQNLLHIPLFGTLQILWLQAFKKSGRTKLKWIATSFVISLTYGCLDEFHQMFVPGRFASLLDILLNIIGVGIGTLLFIFWHDRKYKPVT